MVSGREASREAEQTRPTLTVPMLRETSKMLISLANTDSLGDFGKSSLGARGSRSRGDVGWGMNGKGKADSS